MVLNTVSNGALRLKPLVAGIAFMCIGGKFSVDAFQESRAWQQLAQERDSQTSGTITRATQLINTSSGKVLRYEVSYEFTAPADADTPGGSAMSATELNELVQEQFWQSADGDRGDTDPAQEEVVDEAETSNLPEGELFFRGKQEIETDTYTRQLSGSTTVEIAYDADNPSNSILSVADTPPSAFANPPSLLMLVGGAILTFFGAKQFTRSRR